MQSVHNGQFLFPLLKRLYVDLSLTFAEGQQSYSLMVKGGREAQDAIYAFKLVEVQLGFLFDVLHTKASIIYTTKGLVLRLISVLSIASALAAFIVVIDNTYSRVDIVTTYILFIGAVFLEIYAFVLLIGSDWTMLWLMKSKSRLPCFVCSSICRLRSALCREKGWSGSMAQQHSLVDLCLKQTRTIGTNPFGKISFDFNLFYRKGWIKVNDDLKSLIFQALQTKYITYIEKGFDDKALKELLSHRGNNVTEKFHDVIGWSFEAEFDHGILLWHVATDICYYSDLGDVNNAKRVASKKLSDYFLYILLMRPLMLPKWIGRMIHVRDTLTQAIELFHRRNFPVESCTDACKMLIELHAQYQALEVLRKENIGMSVLLDACHLALQLQNNLRGEGELWGMICRVRIEMLTYAASHGEWSSHVQQLRSGGELLTHVALLMAELGLSEHFDTRTKGPPMDAQNKGWG